MRALPRRAAVRTDVTDQIPVDYENDGEDGVSPK
jgi:hypothetical protein